VDRQPTRRILIAVFRTTPRRPVRGVASALALAGAVLAAAACRGNADFSDAAPEPVTLDADAFRGEITSIDRLVFAEGAFQQERRDELARDLEGLAARVKAASGSRFAALEALELRALAGAARNRPAEALRNEWMRIRNNLFEDRAWFARSAADLEPAAEISEPENARGAAVAGSGAAVSRPVAAAAAGSRGLAGRWRVRAIRGNGRAVSDSELESALWVFSEDELLVEAPAGQRIRYRVTRVEDTRGTALYVESDASAGAAAGKAERGWMLYELRESGLRVAFFDGLGDRPEGFEPPPGRSEPLFLVLDLAREP
jgi:uncharacterized protein (TIGR03067 family)